MDVGVDIVVDIGCKHIRCDGATLASVPCLATARATVRSDYRLFCQGCKLCGIDPRTSGRRPTAWVSGVEWIVQFNG
jgi:hypothetical protein